MGGICLGRVRARKPLFSSGFIKLMNDETEPRNTHSQHPTHTPITNNTPLSYFPHLKTYITTSRLYTTPTPIPTTPIPTTRARTRYQRGWTHKLST